MSYFGKVLMEKLALADVLQEQLLATVGITKGRIGFPEFMCLLIAATVESGKLFRYLKRRGGVRVSGIRYFNESPFNEIIYLVFPGF